MVQMSVCKNQATFCKAAQLEKYLIRFQLLSVAHRIYNIFTTQRTASVRVFVNGSQDQTAEWTPRLYGCKCTQSEFAGTGTDAKAAGPGNSLF